jgi:hypothetical protein
MKKSCISSFGKLIVAVIPVLNGQFLYKRLSKNNLGLQHLGEKSGEI